MTRGRKIVGGKLRNHPINSTPKEGRPKSIHMTCHYR